MKEDLLSLFDFSCQELGLVFARFFIELFLSVLLIWLTSIAMIKATDKKEHECGFTNFVKLSLMYGVFVASLFLTVIVVVMIRFNGIYYFDIDYISWSFYSGYPLILPEIIIITALIISYFVLQYKIKNSLNS